MYGWIDGLDRALNEIDARLKKHPALPERAALTALRAELTTNSLYDEDSIGRPDRIRERVFALAGPLGGNLQPPFEQHQAALADLTLAVATAYQHISRVLGPDFAKTIGMRQLDADAKTLPNGAITTAPKPSPSP